MKNDNIVIWRFEFTGSRPFRSPSRADLGSENVRQKFKGMVKRFTDSGFDPAAGQVEVAPAAHCFMGGVIVDVDTRTEMEGLYVAGEDAGSAHDSYRLGGNGVANSTVYGGVAGNIVGREIRKTHGFRDLDERVLQPEVERAIHPFTKMSVGVAGGSRALNLTWHDWLNLRSLCNISEVIARAGLERENSRGAHFRKDFPEASALDTAYVTFARRRGYDLRLSREPVEFSIVRADQSIPPTEEFSSLMGGC